MCEKFERTVMAHHPVWTFPLADYHPFCPS
jgi:hypothetical protein